MGSAIRYRAFESRTFEFSNARLVILVTDNDEMSLVFKSAYDPTRRIGSLMDTHPSILTATSSHLILNGALAVKGSASVLKRALDAVSGWIAFRH